MLETLLSRIKIAQSIIPLFFWKKSWLLSFLENRPESHITHSPEAVPPGTPDPRPLLPETNIITKKELYGEQK
jgi:hypothetical protein